MLPNQSLLAVNKIQEGEIISTGSYSFGRWNRTKGKMSDHLLVCTFIFLSQLNNTIKNKHFPKWCWLRRNNSVSAMSFTNYTDASNVGRLHKERWPNLKNQDLLVLWLSLVKNLFHFQCVCFSWKRMPQTTSEEKLKF
jgi:hypothetical protein